MPKSRSHGEGALYQRKSGRWCAELDLGHDSRGKRVVWRFSSKSKRSAIAALAKAQTERANHQPQAHTDQPLGEYLSYWLESVKATRSPRTWIGYRSIAQTHVAPAIGHVRLSELRPQHLQSLLTRLSTTLAPVTVLHVHRCLSRALGMAVRWQILDANPAERVDLPRVQKREQQFLTPEQARAFLAAARDDTYYAFWMLALTTGLRTGELVGLQWPDVDGDTLRIQRSLTRVHGQGWQIKDTKTHQSRAIVLTTDAVAALREHRARQLKERLAAGAKWKDQGLVFASPRGTPLDSSNLARRHFRPILERAGLPQMRMYDLRHSVTSLLLSMGINVKTIAEMLGHSDPRMLLAVYGHVTPTLQRDAISRLGDLLAQ